jgi:hypothetical protein
MRSCCRAVRPSRAGGFAAAFAKISQQRAAALSVGTDPLFLSYRDRIIALAAPGHRAGACLADPFAPMERAEKD